MEEIVEELVKADRGTNHGGMDGFFGNSHSALWPLIMSLPNKLFTLWLEREYDEIVEVAGEGKRTIKQLFTESETHSLQPFASSFYSDTVRHLREAIRKWARRSHAPISSSSSRH